LGWAEQTAAAKLELDGLLPGGHGDRRAKPTIGAGRRSLGLVVDADHDVLAADAVTGEIVEELAADLGDVVAGQPHLVDGGLGLRADLDLRRRRARGAGCEPDEARREPRRDPPNAASHGRGHSMPRARTVVVVDGAG